MNRMFYLLLGSMLCLSFIADAALIRGAGKGNDISSEARNFYRIADSHIDALGVKPNFSFTDRATLVQGQIPLFAIPSDCYFEAIFMPPNYVADPCYYQFYQNEMLQLDGYMPMYFENAPLMDLVWTLTGTDFSQTFAGSHLERATLLNTIMPQLAPGEYQVSAMVTFYAGAGYKFYTDPSVHSDNLNCGELSPGDENSYSCSYGWAASESLSFSSYSERVVILAGDKPVDIPLPATVTLFLLSGGLWRWQTRKQK